MPVAAPAPRTATPATGTALTRCIPEVFIMQGVSTAAETPEGAARRIRLRSITREYLKSEGRPEKVLSAAANAQLFGLADNRPAQLQLAPAADRAKDVRVLHISLLSTEDLTLAGAAATHHLH